MISTLLHLVGLRPRVYYTLTNFRGGAKAPLPPPLNMPMSIEVLCALTLTKIQPSMSLISDLSSIASEINIHMTSWLTGSKWLKVNGDQITQQ